MKKKELLAPIYLKNGMAVSGPADTAAYANGSPAELAMAYGNAGIDAVLLFDLSEGDAEHEQAIGQIRKMIRAVDIPVYGGGNIRRLEDVKKLLYAGCRRVFLNYGSETIDKELAREASARFGKEKILDCAGSGGKIREVCLQMEDRVSAAADILAMEDVVGIFSGELMDPGFPVMEFKHQLLAKGILVNINESSLSWTDIKPNSDGLLPVVVQDYKTLEVLMVAYMNQEAFETTLRSGRMTYWSRSRRELWVKGLTSGHFQYVKELKIDCDNDTLLARVFQVGAACHTGNRSCFYRSILKKEYDETNPLKVFEDVFAVIQDRRAHPKEGSYTNYLFDKGIDKILKKVGEEATEIVIAAKNPDPEEIKYEISDFLYHVMVLMVQRGVTWEDITEELARR